MLCKVPVLISFAGCRGMREILDRVAGLIDKTCILLPEPAPQFARCHTGIVARAGYAVNTADAICANEENGRRFALPGKVVSCSGLRLWPPCALGQIALIVYIDALNRLNHAPLALKKRETSLPRSAKRAIASADTGLGSSGVFFI